MSENEFFIVLPSNASLDLYPDNTTSCYTTHLHKEIKLEGRWRVGLSEVIIPHTIFHLQEKDAEFKLTTPTDMFSYKIDHGAYNDIEDLVDAMNAQIQLAEHVMILPPSREGGHFNIQKVCDCEKAHKLHLSGKISAIFGFSSDFQDDFIVNLDSEKKSVRAQEQGDLSRVLPNNVYIYSDICAPYSVGDTQAPLYASKI